MTRYVERGALRASLLNSAVRLAPELADVLASSTSTELVAVHQVTAAALLPTYETRLGAAADGAGARSRGLAEFVEALRDQDVAEMFAVSADDVTGIGLLSSLGHVVAVTLVSRLGVDFESLGGPNA